MAISKNTETNSTVDVNKREHARIRMPIRGLFGKQEFSVSDWSLGGLCIIDNADLNWEIGEIFQATLMIPYQGSTFDIAITCKPVWRDASKKQMGVQFHDLTDQQTKMLRYMIQSYVAAQDDHG